MKRLRNFLRLTSSDRCLLVSAMFLLGAIQLGLWLLPFPKLRRLLQKVSQANIELQEVNSATVGRIAWAVAVVSRYIPGARCLAQALATQVLLGRRGCRSKLCIGVARNQQGQLSAHAWVESQGRIVIGGLGDMSRYTPLPLQEGESYERDRWCSFS